jgi:hypothetical protein
MKFARFLPRHAPFVNMEIFLLFKETNEDVIDFSNNLSAEPTDVCPFFEDILIFRLNLPVQRPDGVTWPITSYRSLKTITFLNLKLSHGVLRLFLPHRVLTETIFLKEKKNILISLYLSLFVHRVEEIFFRKNWRIFLYSSANHRGLLVCVCHFSSTRLDILLDIPLPPDGHVFSFKNFYRRERSFVPL